MAKRGRTFLNLIGLGLALLCGLALIVVALTTPPTKTAAITGTATEIASHTVKGGSDHTVTLSDGRSFVWHCGGRSCAQTAKTLESRAVIWSLPAPARILLRRDEIVGLEIAGSPLIEPKVETARRQGNMLTWLLVGGVGAAVAAILAARRGRSQRRGKAGMQSVRA